MSIHDQELRAVYAQTLIEIAEHDDRIVVVEADLMTASGTRPFKERFGARAIDMGVAEQNMVAFAAGLAAEGKIPFAASFTPFATRRALDQFAISVAYANLPVKLVGTAPGITAALNGGTHMCFADIARMRALPGVIVLAPCDAADVRACVRAAVGHDGPVYLQLIRAKMPAVFAHDRSVDLGQVDLLRGGRDVTIVTSGYTTHLGLMAADIVAARGISAEVINISCIKPLGVDALLDSARKTGFVVTVENGSVIGGLGGAVAEAIAETAVASVHRIGVRDEWGEVGSVDYLAQRYGLTPHQVADDIAGALRCPRFAV